MIIDWTSIIGFKLTKRYHTRLKVKIGNTFLVCITLELIEKNLTFIPPVPKAIVANPKNDKAVLLASLNPIEPTVKTTWPMA